MENNKSFYNGLVINFFSTDIIPFVVKLLTDGKKAEVVFFEIEDYKSAFIEFQTYFEVIKAAGGVVSNSKDEKLFIYRLDKWDLPKGKIEHNEGIEDAAIREVEEECGINGLNIVKQLEDTFHIYTLNDTLFLKQTYWFEMHSDYKGELLPQTEEGITDVEWLGESQVMAKVLDNTYSSIKELLLVSGY